MAKLIIDGQTREVPDTLVQIGATVEEQDRNLRDALRADNELMANATIRREEKGGELVVTVIKNPGTKGASHRGGYAGVLQVLHQAKPVVNPAFQLACEMMIAEGQGTMNAQTIIALRPQIEWVLKKGRADRNRIRQAYLVLKRARAVPDLSHVPVGF
jgi:hypothetical protein